MSRIFYAIHVWQECDTWWSREWSALPLPRKRLLPAPRSGHRPSGLLPTMSSLLHRTCSLFVFRPNGCGEYPPPDRKPQIPSATVSLWRMTCRLSSLSDYCSHHTDGVAKRLVRDVAHVHHGYAVFISAVLTISGVVDNLFGISLTSMKKALDYTRVYYISSWWQVRITKSRRTMLLLSTHYRLKHSIARWKNRVRFTRRKGVTMSTAKR